MNVLYRDIKHAKGAHGGLMTFLFRHMFGDDPSIHFLKMENLRQDLLAWLRAMDIDSSPQMHRFIQEEGKVNPSKHQHYSTYYDADLAALVAERDRLIVDRFSYQFPSVNTEHS